MGTTAMGLLDKTNPRATRRSVIRHSILGAVVIPAFFFALGKPAIRAHWAAFLPVFAVLGALVFALVEWQVDDGPDKPNTEGWGEAFDA
jgi:hypothetical protein